MSVPMVIADFRAAFPEFSDLGKYPDAMLTFWATLATQQVNACRWGVMTSTGIFLYVAHQISLSSQSVASGGASSGSASGPTSSKSVGSVSVSYDTSQGVEDGAGWWNLTLYGKNFIRLARLFGSGAVQI